MLQLRQIRNSIIHRKTFALLALGFASFKAGAQVQITAPSSFRLLAVAPANKVQFKLAVSQPQGKTISQVYTTINGVSYPATTPTGNVYPVNWNTAAFGAYIVKGFVTYSNGSKDSTASLTYKVIQVNTCGATLYSPTTGYMQGDTVATATDSVYRRTSWWMQGDYPTATNTNWAFIGKCNSLMYVNYNCTNIQQWSASATYSTSNTLVNYNGRVYANNWWAQGDVPGVSGAWKPKGACVPSNFVPVIQSAYAKDSLLILNPLATVNIPATITDADGTVTGVSFAINNNPVTPTVNGNNYVINFTPTVYGDYTLKITGTDDENGTGTSTSVIKVMPSLPPAITPVNPVQQQIFGNIVNIGNVPVSLSTTVTDPDNAVASVSFSINAGPQINATASGNTYSAQWTPQAYGTYTLTIKATDAAGASATRTVTFNVDNPNTQAVTFSALPLQLKMIIGNTKTFSFNAAIKSVAIRNKSLAKVVVNSNQLLVTGYRTGRTGLQIVTMQNDTFYVGMRVNKADGSAPGLPPYASIGFVSEDGADLKFWEDMRSGLTNKNMDVRYIYINDGPIGDCEDCTKWRDSMRHINYCKNSLKYGITPFFVYYNIASASESFDADLKHVRDTIYMKAYFKDLNNFLRQCHEVMGDELFGVVLEPDFLGYMQQLGGLMLGNNDPNFISTCVTANGIAHNTGTVKTLVTRINKTIKDRRDMGANLLYGWQMNLWSDGTTAGSKGIMRTTDASDYGWANGRQNVINGATNVTNYIINSGVTTNGADFISMDKYGYDAGAFNTTASWWFNNDHWDNYMLYAKTINQVSGKPVVLWQLPVGHINNTSTKSAYTNNAFTPFNNNAFRREDPCGTYFFGDKFVVNDAAKRSYLLQNNANDTSLHALSNDTLVWGSHMNRFQGSGIIHAMFGAGIGESTNGIKDRSCDTCRTPSDEYWSIQKIQNYYENDISWVDTTIFTNTILAYPATDTCTKSLKNVLGSGTYMYYGYNNLPVSETGSFKPSNLKKGMNYVSFVSNIGMNAYWKVQRIVIGNSSANKQGNSIDEIGAVTGTVNGIYATPNPATNSTVITVANRKGEARLHLVSIDGKLVRSYTMSNDTQVIDLSELQSGLYIIRYSDDAKNASLKIVKQ